MESEVRLLNQYLSDIGVIVDFFLNHVKLNPGEALFLGANEPHAYLSGKCVGMHDSVGQCCLSRSYSQMHRCPNSLFHAHIQARYFWGFTRCFSMNSYVNKYIPRFEEFEFDHYTLLKEERVIFSTVTGPSIFLVTAGKGSMISCKLAQSVMFFLLLLTPRLTSRILEISCKLA